VDDADGGPMRAAPAHRGHRARAWRRPGGGAHRGRARARSQGVLRPAAVQREPRRRAGDDEAPALGRDLLRFRRARLADHGLLAANPGARVLGAPPPGAHARRGRADAELRARLGLGFSRSRAAPRGTGCRSDRLRSGSRGARDARGGKRSARGCAATAPEVHRLSRLDRERPRGAARRRAHRRLSRPRSPRTARHGALTRESSHPVANLDDIIAAAAKVFQTKGYHAATVQDIADAVGILKGSLYHHVKSKEVLLYLIVKEPIARIYERMTEIVDSDLPAAEKLRR